MKRRPFSREQHEAVGQELHQLRDRLLTLSAGIRSRYGRTSRAAVDADRSRVWVDRLRATLDRLAAMDLGEAFAVHLYYPGPTPAANNPLEIQ